jgi:hypothetical protein
MTPYCFQLDPYPFNFLFALEYFLDCFKYQGVGPLYCTVGLRVIYRRERDCHPNLLAKILEHCTIEVLCVVDCNVSGDAVTVDNVLPEEFFDCCRAYIGERLLLYPLHEIFDPCNSEGVVALR